jgi:hypothetical protein
MRKLLTSLLLLVALGTMAQEKQNYLKAHLGYDFYMGKYSLQLTKPGLTYERIFSEHNSINVGAFGVVQFFESLTENSAGKDYHNKISGGGVFITYRRYLSKYKPAPTGLFVEPGVDISYLGATTRTDIGVGLGEVTYKSNYLTTTPFVGFGWNVQISKKLVYSCFKLNLGYLIPVTSNIDKGDNVDYPQSNGQNTFTAESDGTTVTYPTYPDEPAAPEAIDVPGGFLKAVNSGFYFGIGIQVGFGL